MNYYIKVGKMYVYDIYVDSDSIKTEFIKRIDFKNEKDNCMKICDDEKAFYYEKLRELLELYDMSNDNIHFEEVDDEEERSDDLSIE
jgi:hypothetical protein